MKVFAVTLAAVALGCVMSRTGARGETHPLARRAAFDFQCSEKELEFYKLDERSYGVTGCGRRATYVTACQYECTWVLNGAIESTGDDSAPPPAQTP